MPIEILLIFTFFHATFRYLFRIRKKIVLILYLLPLTCVCQKRYFSLYCFNMFKRLWSWLINIGSQPNQSFAEKKKLRLMNATSVAGVLVCGSYLLLDAVINARLAPWIYFVGFINSLLVFYFNAKHLYTLAMYLFFIGNISIVTMLSIIFGEGLAAEHLMFLASINAVFFFDRSKYSTYSQTVIPTSLEDKRIKN